MAAARAARRRLAGGGAPELDDLVERMLAEAGYPVDTADPVDDEGVDPEVIASYRAAHEIAMRSTHGEDVDPGDIGRPSASTARSTSTS